ncbi:hypothetical protein [Halarcobacter ebronensis]|uniref:Uncharacterized protein n=1 Tax=Halarcobacter ebronensis TaxID=1462615 RepID=A0A4Q1ANR8_9BACT|nr:hypothetical protein [Halarcobacter ebronensis]QKF83448.1 putative membrane protein [Halarcobacter ebronensis]RXK08248.1 hypothetical protein CRV07_00110 [Halarcobacter ebronensis]
MEDISIYFQLLTSFLSIVILLAIFFRYYQYKKKLEVLKKLNKLKEQNLLTPKDRDFIKNNHKEYKETLKKDEERIKLIYPLFILIAGVLLAFLPLGEVVIYINVLIVSYIYLQIIKIHNKNFEAFLKELQED